MLLGLVTCVLLFIVLVLFFFGCGIVATVYNERNTLIKETKGMDANHGIVLIITSFIGVAILFLTVNFA